MLIGAAANFLSLAYLYSAPEAAPAHLSTDAELEEYYFSGKVTKILQTNTDDRGLTCIMYIKDGKDTLALDYLTPQELSSLLK